VLALLVNTRKENEELGEADVRRLFSESDKSEFIEVLQLVLKRSRVSQWPTIERMADLANMSARTLQRRLADDGHTYSRLVDQTRAELAFVLLHDSDRTPGEIAVELGYSEPNNFSRAFKRWTGKTPDQYRSGQQKIESAIE
jgi:AraC-like DNA-binding protein